MRKKCWFLKHHRLWGLLCGLTLAVAQFFSPASMGIAQAATTTCTPTGTGQDCIVTFAYSGAPESWTVPAGVINISFQVYGAQGGSIPGYGAGGNGGATTATLAVTPGQVLQINIGGQGVSPSLATLPNGGGFNGGGSTPYCGSASGRGGGGASDVRWDDPSVSGVFTLDERLLVAGGGGGAAFERNGGAGGGINGTDGADGIGGEGGGGGSQTAGGAGGQGSATGCYAINGDNGSFGGGGTGGSAGGGGGGGYYGGGGGGSPSNGGRPGAGGGGSGFGPAGAIFETGVRAGNGLVILSYSSDTTAPVANPTQSPAAAPSGWNNTAVTVSWNWSDPATGYVSGIDPANCTTSSVSSGSGTINLSATCKDLAGNTGTATYQVKVDPTAPTANPSQSPAANGAGWNKTDVTVNWNWTFTGAIIDTANCTTSLTSSGEGALTLSATCKDVALNQRTVTYGVKVDKTAPVVTVTGVSADASYTVGSVPTAACSTTDATSGVATPATVAITGGNADGTGSFTATCSGATDVAGNSAAAVSVNYSVTPPPDTTAPVITAQVNGTLGNNDWYVSDVIVGWTVVDAESTISSQSGCETQNITSDTSGVTFTCSATSTGGSNSQSITTKRDATAPVVTLTGVSAGGNYMLGSVPTAACSTTDALSGVATQATLTITGGNADGTGNFTATCSGAIDLAGNSAAPISVSYVVTAPVDACTTTALRDDFNRANGGLGSNWAGLTGQSFYKIANQQVDVQLGGPVVWKPTTFGVNQAAFVTLSTLDANSPSQGVLLKVQGGTIPNAGAISVVYDSRAKAVRVSTLRLNTLAWTVYGHTPATFANGDKLLGCVQANGTVRVYKNTTLLTTVTLNAADQSFFNAKGGKIGLWTVAAINAFFDDFGGGALTGVTGAMLDATAVPDEVADDGAEITVAVDFPTDDAANSPDGGAFVNHIFLPMVNR